MEDARHLRLRADEHRTAARAAADLWESVLRFSLAARYEELAARREATASATPMKQQRAERVG